MPSKDVEEDLAFFLYLLPLAASIIYGAYEWSATAHTSTMPFLAYVVVAKSQFLFLASMVAICLAIVLEVRSANFSQREAIVKDNSRRLQMLAVVILIISLAAAVSVAKYNLPNALSVFVQGRYPLIYAFFLVGISLLLSPKQIMGNVKISSLPEIFGMIVLVASPLVFYAGLKIKLSFTASGIAGILTAIIGLILLLGVSAISTRKAVETVQKAA